MPAGRGDTWVWLCPSCLPVPFAEVELGRQRRGRHFSPSPTAPALHRPQGKRKAPEEREGSRVTQPSPRHAASPGMETWSGTEMGWDGTLRGSPRHSGGLHPP